MEQNCRADDVNMQKANTQSSDPRVHFPEECSKAKVVENCQHTFCADQGEIETVFRTIISVNQLNIYGAQLCIYGAVSEMCEECDTCQDRTRRPVVAGQSNPLFVPNVMKTHIPMTDDPETTRRRSIAKISGTN